MNSQCILTIRAFAKIHLKKSHFIFALRLMLFDRNAYFLFYVPSAVNIYFFAVSLASIYLPRGPAGFKSPNRIFVFVRKVLVAPAPLRILTKPTVRPQRR